MLPIVYAFKQCSTSYVTNNSRYELITETIYLNAQASAKVTRWKLAIQEYDFYHRTYPWSGHIVADGMSRFAQTALTLVKASVSSNQILFRTMFGPRI
jgi:hypothetical protein